VYIAVLIQCTSTSFENYVVEHAFCLHWCVEKKTRATVALWRRFAKTAAYFRSRRSVSGGPILAASFHRSQAVAHLPRVDAGGLAGGAYEWPKNHAICRRVAVTCWWPLLNRQPKWLPSRDVSSENTAIRMRNEHWGCLFPSPALTSSRDLFGFSAWLS
jgi:hypothetical protein